MSLFEYEALIDEKCLNKYILEGPSSSVFIIIQSGRAVNG